MGKYKLHDSYWSANRKKAHDIFATSIIIRTVLESTDYLFIECIFNKNAIEITGKKYNAGILGCINKKNKTLVFTMPQNIEKKQPYYSEIGLINDIDGGLNVYPQQIINNSTIVQWINVIDLKKHVASESFKNTTPKYPEKKKQLIKLANSLTENDNPVLMLVKLKE